MKEPHNMNNLAKLKLREIGRDIRARRKVLGWSQEKLSEAADVSLESVKRAEILLYAEDGWDSGRIISVIEQKQSIKEYAFILHDSDLDELGQPKKAHYHIYLVFGNCNLQFQHVAAWFQVKPQMVQKIKT